jgi:hypothetical protein
MNKWQTLNKFINSNESFTKIDLKRNVPGFKDSNYKYLNYLIVIGILDKTNLVSFKRIAKLPENISYNKIKKISHSSDYDKMTFFRLISRKEKLHNIKNSSLY